MKTLIHSLLAISALTASAATFAAQPSFQESFVATVLAPATPHTSVSLTSGASRAAADGDARDQFVSKVLLPRLLHVEPTTVTSDATSKAGSTALNSYL